MSLFRSVDRSWFKFKERWDRTGILGLKVYHIIFILHISHLLNLLNLDNEYPSNPSNGGLQPQP